MTVDGITPEAWNDVIGEKWTEIATSRLDRHNDALQIYARRDGDRFLLTDDSYTIHDLEGSGYKLDAVQRGALQLMIADFSVRLNNDALETWATSENFEVRAINLISVMLAVGSVGER